MSRGLIDSGFLYEKSEEVRHEGMRLGRNQWLDGRSLAFMVENDARAMGQALGDQHWDRVLAILDQGDLGSCTGNAGTGALGTQPLGHAADLLRMVTGEADPVRAAGLDAYLVTVVDHGMNASTFTARVIAGTGSDFHSCITGAIGALRGPKHGGANEVALEIQQRYASPDEAEADIVQFGTRTGRNTRRTLPDSQHAAIGQGLAVVDFGAFGRFILPDDFHVPGHFLHAPDV